MHDLPQGPADLREEDWQELARLRGGFLHDPTRGDYWRGPRSLAAYDVTFAARIGWKWDAVLGELQARRWSPPAATRIIDFGCGSGVAHRRWLAHFPAVAGTAIHLIDRSPLAQAYAAERLAASTPAVSISRGEHLRPGEADGAIVLLSHVLNELAVADREALVQSLRGAAALVWVEGGQQAVARPLVELRERLLAEFRIVAPCTHGGACGLLSPENAPHWCHHFARPPAEAFMDAGWARFARMLEIDLRSLPYSFLVGDRQTTAPAIPGADWSRVLGHPREARGYLKVLGCDVDGVHERMLQERDDKAACKRLSKARALPLYRWTLKPDGKIARAEGYEAT